MTQQRPKIGNGRVVVLPLPAPPPLALPPPQEIVLDGRKYRLVPLEGEPVPPPPAMPARPSERPAPPEILTARELQIVGLVAEGHANKQIAAELGISEWTVSTHLRRIYAKLDVDTRAAMVNRCYGVLMSRGGPPGA
jgi:DNA-binding CsgD family transcriptional regulator